MIAPTTCKNDRRVDTAWQSGIDLVVFGGRAPPPGEPGGGALLLGRHSPALAKLQPPPDTDGVLRGAESALAPGAFEAQPDP